MTIRAKLVKGFGGFYKVREDGTLWSCRMLGNIKDRKGPWKKMTPTPNETGHLNIGLSIPGSGKRVTIFVHRLVLEAFVGPCPPGMECRHYPDQNPANNNLTNLSWADRGTNQLDRKGQFVPRGEKQWCSKLTEKQVIEIREIAKKGKRGIGIKLAKKYGVSKAIISSIRLGHRWKHVPESQTIKKAKKKG